MCRLDHHHRPPLPTHTHTCPASSQPASQPAWSKSRPSRTQGESVACSVVWAAVGSLQRPPTTCMASLYQHFGCLLELTPSNAGSQVKPGKTPPIPSQPTHTHAHTQTLCPARCCRVLAQVLDHTGGAHPAAVCRHTRAGPWAALCAVHAGRSSSRPRADHCRQACHVSVQPCRHAGESIQATQAAQAAQAAQEAQAARAVTLQQQAATPAQGAWDTTPLLPLITCRAVLCSCPASQAGQWCDARFLERWVTLLYAGGRSCSMHASMHMLYAALCSRRSSPTCAGLC